MNTHYIPRLLLKQFSTAEKVNTYDFQTSSFSSKKLKKTFCENNLFDAELEHSFSTKLEGPFGDLLNHKLLHENEIIIERKENLLIRKFVMVNDLRAPILKDSWDKIMERTRLQNHPTAQTTAFLMRHHSEFKKYFEQNIHVKENYISDLKKAMEIDSLSELCNPDKNPDISRHLTFSARRSMAAVIAFWDSEKSGQEFILPKLPGISLMDQWSVLHKCVIIRDLLEQKKEQGWKSEWLTGLEQMLYGTIQFSENFCIHTFSPTRIMITFSPYFKAFFPILPFFPPLLKKEQFDHHFFKPMRLKLFEPCKKPDNDTYHYTVKVLTKEEVQLINSVLLDMETEEFVFHDFNKIRDSFWYYDHMAKFADPPKHNFSRWE